MSPANWFLLIVAISAVVPFVVFWIFDDRKPLWNTIDEDGPFLLQRNRMSGALRTAVRGSRIRQLHPDMKPRWHGVSHIHDDEPGTA